MPNRFGVSALDGWENQNAQALGLGFHVEFLEGIYRALGGLMFRVLEFRGLGFRSFGGLGFRGLGLSV